RWKQDADGEVMRRAKQTVRAMYNEASRLSDVADRKALARWGTQSESEARLRAAVSLAESESDIVVSPNDLDCDPWLLNVANGTVDLIPGALREHRRSDLITKLAPVVYERDAHSPLWDSFLAKLTADDLELEAFLQRAVGYSLVGSTEAEVLFFAHGP